MPPRKISGSQLLEELGADTFDRHPTPAPPPAPAAPKSVNTGRPSKVGKDFVPMTVRVGGDQAEALRKAALAKSQAADGKTIYTPQDILRLLVDRAMADPGFPANIIEQDPS